MAEQRHKGPHSRVARLERQMEEGEKMNDVRPRPDNDPCAICGAPWKQCECAPGPTGDFPQGKISDEDEGGIVFAIGRKDEKIFLDFGKPVSWIGMDRNTAINIGLSLLKQAGIKMEVVQDKNELIIKS